MPKIEADDDDSPKKIASNPFPRLAAGDKHKYEDFYGQLGVVYVSKKGPRQSRNNVPTAED